MNNNFNNTIPIYIQVIDYIKTYIISGKISPGEKLPSVRELANIFKINPNTIQKALTYLEDINLIYTESTNGKYVTKDKKIIDKLRLEVANNIVNNYYDSMRNIGIEKIEAIKYLKEDSDK